MTWTLEDRWRELRKPGRSVSRGLILESCPTPPNSPNEAARAFHVLRRLVVETLPHRAHINYSADAVSSRSGSNKAKESLSRGIPQYSTTLLSHTDNARLAS